MEKPKLPYTRTCAVGLAQWDLWRCLRNEAGWIDMGCRTCVTVNPPGLVFLYRRYAGEPGGSNSLIWSGRRSQFCCQP